MKLNNRGWGLQAMLVGVLVLMIALVIIAVLIQNTFNNIMEPINNENQQTENNDKDDNEKYESYEEIEGAIVSAAKKYQKKYYSDILDGEKISVTLKNLQEEKLIDEIIDIEDSDNVCSGYAIFINDDNKIIYNAYIKCGNYETIGYQDFYDVDF